ncbi:hypothetical protein [Kordia sp.]|uniref:hypothetical protein n=1 Tax=Kordia sp. TaxID=1965332 RepID=UPI003D2B21AD
MRKLILIVSTLFFISCAETKDNQPESSISAKAETVELGTGACEKCGCKSWRGDSDEPEKCINIRSPKKTLCQHSKKDHK